MKFPDRTMPRAQSAAARTACIDVAIRDLRSARDALVKAGAVRTVSRVRAALKSADGARRHARLADIRGERQAETA